jgi:hypothetical protein
VRALIVVTAVLLVAGGAAAAEAAQRPTRIASHCSESGDVCYGIFRRDGAVFLDITTFARYFERYRLCVVGPRGRVACRSFPIRRQAQLWGSSVRWHTNFPREGPGRYRVTWRLGSRPLGPALTFRVR